MIDVFITKASRFLPNDPVENDDMETFLGMVDGKPSKARRVILRRNGIKQRYYALDKDGNVTHTNVQMAANAVLGLLDDQLTIDDIDLLSCGTGSPEQLIPSHGVMVHGELGGKKHMEVVSFAGSCCSGADALKYAYMAVKLGLSKNAVAVASERSSAWMRASYFQKESEQLAQLEDHPMLAFQKDFLRWMLSDGAFSVLLQGKPSASGLSLRLDWIDITSYANTKETCMYARMLSEYIVPLGVQYLIEMGKKHQFTPDDVDWFLPHMSSMFFKDVILEETAKQGFFIPEERWFYNLPKIGNIGSASAFAMLEELMDSGLLKQGQKVLVMVPESARFSYCYFMLTVC